MERPRYNDNTLFSHFFWIFCWTLSHSVNEGIGIPFYPIYLYISRNYLFILNVDKISYQVGIFA